MTQVDTHQPSTRSEAQTDEQPAIYAMLAEYSDVDTVMRGARAMRDAGYQRFDVHSPFPIHGIDDAIGIKPTILPWIVLLCGLTGMIGGLVLAIHTMGYGLIPQEWLPVHLEGYGYLISGKPLNSGPAWIPVVFECTILLSAFGAVFGMFLLNKLPLLYEPLFKHERFRRATSDRFFIVVQARDGRFDLDETRRLLQEHGATAVEVVEE